MKDLPKFSGWRPLKPDERTIKGDVFVRVGDYPMRDKRTPETGDKLYGSSIGRLPSMWEDSCWWVYRNESAPTISRRLIGHKMFSVPLPLP